MEKSQAEMIVKVISIIGFIGSVLGFIGGVAMLFGGTFIVGLLPMLGATAKGLVGVIVIVMAILAVLLSVFGFIVALNLWRHKNWARIVVIVFSGLGILQSLFSMPMGFIGLVINGFAFYFLTFDKDVMKLFK